MPSVLKAQFLRLLAMLGMAFLGMTTNADETSAKNLDPPPFEHFLVLPLKVHLLTSNELTDVDCKLADADVTRILGKMNRIWHQAGIHWALESLVREPAASQAKFRLARELNGPKELAIYRILVPNEGRDGQGLHVYYLHKLLVNGVWMGEDFALVKETAELRKVEGGIDEPVPRVTAHELGHALGLSHRENKTNLLASGTTGTSLDAHEVEIARTNTKDIPGVKTAIALKAESETEKDPARARQIRAWLAEIPGSETAKAP